MGTVAGMMSTENFLSRGLSADTFVSHNFLWFMIPEFVFVFRNVIQT